MRAGLVIALLLTWGCAPGAGAELGRGAALAAGGEGPARSKQDVRPDTRLVDDWAELAPALAGVYLAEVGVRTDAGGFNELCAAPTELLFGAALPRRRVCTRLDGIAASGLSWPPLPTSGAAVVATVRRGGQEAILGAVAVDAC